jgi:hypothetical protein
MFQMHGKDKLDEISATPEHWSKFPEVLCTGDGV